MTNSQRELSQSLRYYAPTKGTVGTSTAASGETAERGKTDDAHEAGIYSLR